MECMTGAQFEIEFEQTRDEAREMLLEEFGVSHVSVVADSVFGEGDRVPGHSNVMSHSGTGIPSEWPDGTDIAYGNHRPAQILHEMGWEMGSLYIIQEIVEYLNDVQDAPPQDWQIATIVDTVAEAWAFKIELAETAVSHLIETYTDLVESPRTPREVGRDEHASVDLRMVAPSGEEVTVQVKTDVSNPSKEGCDYLAVIDTETATLEIRE
jgi:hypothetical protein